VRIFRQSSAGQALVEISLVLPILCVFVLGIVDFSRALYDAQVVRNLSGEGSSLASRGTSLTDTINTVVADAGSDLNMAANGCVIVSSVTLATATNYVITAQAKSSPCNSASSKLGCIPPPATCTGQTTSLPPSVAGVISGNPNYTAYVTEVYYNFTPVTPIGAFLKNNNLLPTQLYSGAYY